MAMIYQWCALVGGGILVIQIVLQVIGLGGDSDADGASHATDLDDAEAPDLEGNFFFKLLSLKTVVAFSTFFGLSGLACLYAEMASGVTVGIALASGVGAMFLVSYLMGMLSHLQSSGNVQLENAVGKMGRVYLRVPEKNSGQGKITISLQGRRIECKAVTGGDEIPKGVEVRVTACPASDTLEVRPVMEERDNG